MNDYSLLSSIYKDILRDDFILGFSRFAQASCGFFIMVVLIRKLLFEKNAMGEHDKIKPGDIMRPLMIMGVVFTYPMVLNFLDFFASSLEKYFLSGLQNQVAKNPINYFDFAESKMPPDANVWQRLEFYVSEMYFLFTHPGVMIMDNFRIMFMGIDTLIFIFFITIRFFKMMVLRITGSFAILASMYHRYEGFAANWAKLYVINYLWIYFIFLANFICEKFFWGIIESKKLAETGSHGSMSVIIFMVMIFVKISLYKKSYDFLKSIFSNS
jgi:hypothetical protein